MYPLHLWLHATSDCLQLVLRIFATTKSNFNYICHCCDFVALIDNFTLWVRWFLCLFSFMNRFICPITHNNDQVSCIELKIFYGDLAIYFYVCIEIVFKIHYSYDKYVFNFFLYMHIYVQCSYIEFRNSYFELKKNI